MTPLCTILHLMYKFLQQYSTTGISSENSSYQEKDELLLSMSKQLKHLQVRMVIYKHNVSF